MIVNGGMGCGMIGMLIGGDEMWVCLLSGERNVVRLYAKEYLERGGGSQ